MAICEVDPAELRFTQDIISLYFEAPHNHFNIREAVRSISRKKMTPDEFPTIRVIAHQGHLWSMDNRRLWVFRFARCSRVSVILQSRMHTRLGDLIKNPRLMRSMEEDDFFPRVRDRRRKDSGFDHLFPQPSSFHRATNDPGVTVTRETNGNHENDPRVSDSGETNGNHQNDPGLGHTRETDGDHERSSPEPEQPSFQTVGYVGFMAKAGCAIATIGGLIFAAFRK